MVAPYKRVFILTALLSVLLAPLAVIRPKLLQVMVDDYIMVGNLNGMAMLAVIIFGVLLSEVICRYLFLYHADWIGQAVIRDLRVKVFRHITRLRLSFFDKTPIGQATTRTINDIEAINTVFSQGSITILADLLTLLAVVIMMLITSWKLTLVVLSVFPLLIWGSIKFKRAIRKSYENVRTHISNMNAFLQERITGMRIIQVFNAEEEQEGRFQKINRDYTSANLRAILAYAIFFPVVDLISALSLGLMVWYGARGVLQDQVTLGTMIAFPLYIGMLYRPIRMLADKFNTLQMGLIAADRVFQVLENKSTMPNDGKHTPEKLEGELEFENVHFEYIEGEPILKNVSFKVPSGDTLAIVGSTGSGKTTIISLINRFYDIQKGKILIDDREIFDYELSALRSRIAVVLQDVFLFSGSVFDNITLRDPRFSKEEVVEAAKLIGAHEFIERLPGGYEYQVMERGATLSMGQRQLISFVRALVFNPDILILDEATSSIDPETEGIIQYAIEKLIAKRTSIIIAHRLTTIRHADKVLVLDQGVVAEYGTHDELLENPDGKYRDLYEKQFLTTEETAEEAKG